MLGLWVVWFTFLALQTAYLAHPGRTGFFGVDGMRAVQGEVPVYWLSQPLLAALLTACATATPYQPNVPGQQATGGFTDQRLESDRYRVTFAGNSLTSRETVEGYLLFRAAELTVQQGFDWFSIVDRNTDRKSYTYVDPDPLYSPWYGPGYGYWRPSWRYRGVYCDCASSLGRL